MEQGQECEREFHRYRCGQLNRSWAGATCRAVRCIDAAQLGAAFSQAHIDATIDPELSKDEYASIRPHGKLANDNPSFVEVRVGNWVVVHGGQILDWPESTFGMAWARLA